jgi:hypothetical protein
MSGEPWKCAMFGCYQWNMAHRSNCYQCGGPKPAGVLERPGAFDCPHGRAVGFCPHGCNVPTIDYSGVLELLPDSAVEPVPSYGDYYSNKGRTK